MGSRFSQVSEELLARCLREDEAARGELFDLIAPDVHRIIWRLAYRDDDPEDLCQEVFLALWRSLDSYRGEASFSSFVYGICLNVARRHRRSWARFSRLRRAVAEEEPEAPMQASQLVAQRERAEAVRRVLDRLSFKARTALVLFEMEGLSGPEIATQLGIPEKTVWTRLHHARKAFRRLYRAPGEQD